MLGACSADETYLAAARIARQSLEDILRRGTTCETSTAGHARQITQARPYVATSPPSFRRKLDARACRGRGSVSELVVEVGSPGWARTSDPLINSQVLYRLSYRGIQQLAGRHADCTPLCAVSCAVGAVAAAVRPSSLSTAERRWVGLRCA